MAVQKHLSRRGFLTVGALAAAGGLLAACAQQAAPTVAPAATAKPAEKPTEAPKPTATTAPAAASPTTAPAVKPTEAPKPTAAAVATKPAAKPAAEVNLVAAEWVIQEWKLPDWIAEYNKLGRGKVNLEQEPQGFEAKLQAMVKSGDVLYDGYGIMTPVVQKVAWVASETIQPLDGYISSSDVAGAKEILTDMVPSIKLDNTYKGKLYGIPYSIEANALMYYTEPLKAVGYDKAPTTWDETLEVARKMGKELKSKQITPIAWVNAIDSSVEGLLHGATKKPYTDEGIVDVTSEAGIKVVKFLQTLFKEGLTPPHGTDGYLEMWQRATLGMLFGQNSRGVWAQRIHGMDKAGTVRMPVMDPKVPHSGSSFWSNSFCIMNKAKNPQAAVDFYIWLLNPANAPVHQAIIESGKGPAFNTVYDKQVKPNKDYAWMIDHRDMIAESVPYPENAFWGIQNDKIFAWLTKLMEKDTKLTPEEAMNNAVKEIKDEVAKMKVK